MRPMRGGGGFGGFGGGGTALDTMAAKLAVAVVALSVVFLLAQGSLGELLLLTPEYTLSRLLLWQPVTYAFIAPNPIGIIFSGLIIWSMGGGLEMTLGPRRLLLLSVGLTALAGVLTLALAFVTPVLPAYAGATVMTSVVWVAYGLYIGRGQTNFWGIPLTGNAFAAIGVGFVLLYAVANGWRSHLPELIALGLTYAYVRGGSPRTLWLRFNHKRLQRRLTGRPKHLRVVNRNKADRDQYLN
jgi:membrane associated rhomboid family serine protease